MQDTIAGIILAAGASSRMGRPKALLPIGADTFVTRLIRTLAEAGAAPVVVVCGVAADGVRAAIATAAVPGTVVVNPSPDLGQLSSLIVGLAAVGDDVSAALVCLVDAPLVSPATVGRVMTAFRETGAPIVRPCSGERHGHPVLFSRGVFDDLRQADPAVGAKAVVRARASEVAGVEVQDPGAFIDIDTPADYERWITGERRAGQPA